MQTLKKYNFEIRTLKNLQDSNSPNSLSKFEFLAISLESAEKYKNSLIEHYNENMPYRSKMPRETTELIESEY